MSIKLHDYQIEGARWLSENPMALLADDMGIGKTAQAIRAADDVGAKRVCVICPSVARVNWAREFEKFSRFKRDFDIIDSQKPVWRPNTSLIFSYDLARHFSKLIAGPFDALILDESHYIVNPEANRTAEIYGANGIVREAKRIWPMSATPAPNHAGELWAMLYTFGATKLTHAQFLDKFCDGVYMNGKMRVKGTKKAAIPELRAMLKPFILRRKKEDVALNLPPIVFNDMIVEPGEVILDVDTPSSLSKYVIGSDQKLELYEKLMHEESLVQNIIDTVGLTGAGLKMLEALAPSISTLRMYAGAQMMDPCAKIVREELSSGAYEKIVIFAHHRDVIEGLRVRLNKFRPVTLYGGTPPEKRQLNIDNFQKNPYCRVFIGNIRAAGPSITLTAAHQVMFVEQDWVPGYNAQAAMRVHRIGQKYPVFVRFMSIAGGIHEKIAIALKRKTKELAEIFDQPGA